MEDGRYGYDDEYDYMEQEEEWDRQGMLDPAWERQQKKVRLLAYFSLGTLSLKVYRSQHVIRNEKKSRSNSFLQNNLFVWCP